MPTTVTKVAASPSIDAAPPKSAMDLLGSMARAKPAGKAKETKPSLNMPELDSHIATFIAQKAAEETAAALKDAAKDQITMAVGPQRLRLCTEAGVVMPSITVNGRLTFTRDRRYSLVVQERRDDLLDTFGEKFKTYFAETLAISLKPEAAANETVLAEMIEKLGPEFLAQHFDIRRDMSVTEAFHHGYSTDPIVREQAKPFIDDQTIKPYAPSLKIK